MFDELTDQEQYWVNQLERAIRLRNRPDCDRAIATLDGLMGAVDTANFLTEYMATLAPRDFEGTLWLLASTESDPSSSPELTSLLGSELAGYVQAPTAPSATEQDALAQFFAIGRLLPLVTSGPYAVALDPEMTSQVLLVQLPDTLVAVYPDETTALDAMLALSLDPGFTTRPGSKSRRRTPAQVSGAVAGTIKP